MSRRFIVGCAILWCVLSVILFALLAISTPTYAFYGVYSMPIASLETMATVGGWEPTPDREPVARRRLLTTSGNNADVRVYEIEELSSGERSVDWNTIQIELRYWPIVVGAVIFAIPPTAFLGGLAALWKYLRRKKGERRGFEVIDSSSGGQHR